MNKSKRFKPLPYQKEGVLDIEDCEGRTLLADEMGLGKTMQALWFLKRERIPTWPAIVVCPAAVKYHWEHNAITQIGAKVQVLEGTQPADDFSFDKDAKMIIVNYDILRYWLCQLDVLGPTTIILDECHMIQNPASLRTKATVELCRGVPNVLALSGTPLTNRPSELWPTLNIIWPDAYPSFFTFATEHCKPRKRFGRWEFKGADNLPQLHTKLRRCGMVRRLKVDVLKDLPAKVRHVHPMEIRDREQYDHATTDFKGWLKQNKAGQYARAIRAEQLAKVGYLLRLAAKLKVRSVVDWANKFLHESDEKLVLFGIHQKMIDVLAKRVKGKSVVVTGSVTGRHRQDAVNKFRTDPNCRVFIANIKAAGTGVDGLQDAASTMAFAELWWRPGDLVQAEDRLHRMGQDAPTWINYLVATGTIEEKLCQILQDKQEVFRATLDGGQTPTNDLDVLDQLIAAMETGQ